MQQYYTYWKEYLLYLTGKINNYETSYICGNMSNPLGVRCNRP